MPVVKHAHGQPKNNKRIHSKNEEKKSSKKISISKKLDADKENIFRSLAVAFFKDKEKWKDVKFVMKDQLIKQKELYSNIFGYNMNYLMAVLSYLSQTCLMEFWFYSSECAQLVSDTFNVPVIVFGTGSATSLLFLPYN
ncbi:12937_t:CDS:2 [Cetraspora pellucida]|uniref:12937_t:CDS:1 n=1 Tax=Cetraspora pellucida TaxID=1433469 RepID=A0ACA9PJD8_9GLOM|nr:12937_t:CDS:2 [Cetraspora pellucida]